MLTAAIAAMCCALLLGLWLSVHALLADAKPAMRPPILTGALHALAGTSTVLLLGLCLTGPKRGLATGASSFGPMSFALLAIALAGGALIAVTRLRKRSPPVVLIATHATVAIAGIVLMAAWWAAPPAHTP